MLLRAIPELARVAGPVFLAIGVFDGVHPGHRAVIRRACDDAARVDGTAVVVTFDPHPATILRPGQAPRLLTSTAHKVRLVSSQGAACLLIIPFDAEFAATPPDLFIRSLAAACTLREICVGHEWSFGRGRAGNLDMLRALGDELGFDEVGVEAVRVEGEIISSTLIRACVQSGDLARAEKFLGRPYSVLGTVIAGQRLGRTLGFPTANLSAHREQFPPDGVYAVEAEVRGQRRIGVANIGVRPTVAAAGGERLLELHIFDFSGDIYHEDVEVTFRHFLRGEKRFDGIDELRAQIEIDSAAARSLLTG